MVCNIDDESAPPPARSPSSKSIEKAACLPQEERQTAFSFREEDMAVW